MLAYLGRLAAAALQWTFLGSFLLNLWTSYSPGDGTGNLRPAPAIVIAAASMLQAAVGGTAVRRAIGYPSPLDNVHDVLRFLLLSPVFCLTSATLSLAGLWALGIVELGELFTN